jgi:hypothetical protein
MDATIHNTICKRVHVFLMSFKAGSIIHTDNKTNTFDDIHDLLSDDERHLDNLDDEENTINNDSDKLDDDHDMEDPTNDTPQFNTTEYFSKILATDSISDNSQPRLQTEDLAHSLIPPIQSCTDKDVLTTVREHLQSAITVVKAKNSIQQQVDSGNDNQLQTTQTFNPIITMGPNSNNVKQLRFISTKRKKKE